MRVLVLGGTGVAGRLTVAELRRRGHEVRMLSRRAGSTDVAGVEGVAGDLLTGAGLAEALSGVDTVVDTSNFATMNYDKAAGMFEASMRRLGELVVDLGGGRRHPDDCIDVAVGLDRVRAVGEGVQAGEPLLRLCLRDAEQIEWARARALAAFEIGEPVPAVPLVQAHIDVESD